MAIGVVVGALTQIEKRCTNLCDEWSYGSVQCIADGVDMAMHRQGVQYLSVTMKSSGCEACSSEAQKLHSCR